MNKEDAIKATTQGSIAAFVSAVLSLIVVVFSIASNASGDLAVFNDPANFLDVVFLLLFSWGMYKKSRVAAIFAIIHLVLSKIIVGLETQQVPGIAIALIFLYFYFKAAKGAFVFHKIEKAENPEYKISSIWKFVIAPLALISFLLVGVGLMTMTGAMPSTQVQSKKEIISSDIDTLKANGIISEDEEVQFFYSQGFLSILDSGNLMTQERVILYINSEDEGMTVYSLQLDEVSDVILESKGDHFNDSVYRVVTDHPDKWLTLYLSAEKNRDQDFVDALRARIKR